MAIVSHHTAVTSLPQALHARFRAVEIAEEGGRAESTAEARESLARMCRSDWGQDLLHRWLLGRHAGGTSRRRRATEDEEAVESDEDEEEQVE